MKFSVITATFNAEKTLKKCLDSVQKNKSGQLEHIVVDGLSADRTVEIARSYPDVICISGKDHGIYDAMNKGIRHTRNEILSFLNADDFYLDGTLEKVMKVFEEHPESDIVYGNIVVNGRICRPAKGAASFQGARIFHPAAFIRRSLFDRLGLYDDQYRICADLDFFIRAKKAGAVFTYLDEPLTDFALDGVSTRRRHETALEVRKILRAHGFGFLFSWGYFFSMELRGLAARVLKGGK